MSENFHQGVTLFAGVFALIVALPIALFAIECAAALLPRRNLNRAKASRPSIVVLVPAHDEENGIAATVGSILPQLFEKDRLIVVADNCSDHTANVARAAGAEVLVRRDPDHRGKGYALAFGVEYLKRSPPAVLVCLDADCPISNGVLDRLVERAVQCNRPAQALYRLEALRMASPKTIVSSLAFAVKNVARPTGLTRLGIPVALTGTGMAFPWAQISNVPLASGHLVEDMKLGLDLMCRGYGPVLCEDAIIYGALPVNKEAALVQRTRWEHGHLSMVVGTCVPLAVRGLVRLRVDWVIAALDLAVPPLALLSVIWVGSFTGAIAAAVLTGTHWPLVVSGLSGLALFASVVIAWWKFARELPATSLLAVPGYVLWKIPMYLSFPFRRQKSWLRTARENPLATDALRSD